MTDTTTPTYDYLETEFNKNIDEAQKKNTYHLFNYRLKRKHLKL